jgi:cell division FtsZ-interacting protein ZapD
MPSDSSLAFFDRMDMLKTITHKIISGFWASQISDIVDVPERGQVILCILHKCEQRQ